MKQQAKAKVKMVEPISKWCKDVHQGMLTNSELLQRFSTEVSLMKQFIDKNQYANQLLDDSVPHLSQELPAIASDTDSAEEEEPRTARVIIQQRLKQMSDGTVGLDRDS